MLNILLTLVLITSCYIGISTSNEDQEIEMKRNFLIRGLSVTSLPTSQPTDNPTSQPVRKPSNQPTSIPSRQPTMQPSRGPTGREIIFMCIY